MWRCSTSRPGDVRVAGQVVDVQLDRGRAGVLHRACVVGPAAGRDAVEAGDHRDARPRPRRARAGSGSGVGRGPPRRSAGSSRAPQGSSRAGGVDEPSVARGLLSQLLLEQREQHDRADAGVRQPPYAVERVGERRGEATSGLRSCKAHVVGREVHQRSLRASAGKACAAAAWPSPRRSRQRGRRSAGRAPASRSASAGSALASARKRSSPFRVVGERHPRPRRVEQERVAAARRAPPGRSGSAASGRWRPRGTAGPARRCISIAVCDAVAVGDHERRPVVGLGLAERASASAGVGAHRDPRDVDVGQ